MTCSPGIITLDRIKELITPLDLCPLIEEGFTAYSRGEVVVPPVGELCFDTPPGDTHIKYGHVKGADHFVIKIASGFYNNPGIGLPSNSGLMLVFSSRTGILDTILMDEGYLTDLRTALAGQIAARYLARPDIRTIGVLGTGIQARMQVEHLLPVTPCRNILVWGRTPEKAVRYQRDMQALGYSVQTAKTPADVAARADLIITTTPAEAPLLSAADIRPGTHITAMGSDTPAKQELDTGILEKADIVVADSISQCRTRGEISKALAEGYITKDRILELGRVIETSQGKEGRQPRSVRLSDSQITIADLTGVAVQDIQIATAVCRALKKTEGKPHE